jgi:hypothetical protein
MQREKAMVLGNNVIKVTTKPGKGAEATVYISDEDTVAQLPGQKKT